jgi:hypothetical protein
MVKSAILLAAGLLGIVLSQPANASVVYDLTLAGTDGGSGTLTLNFPSITAAENIGYTSIAPYFVGASITADGQVFNITPSNLAEGFISTGSAGQLYTLTLEQTEPTGDSSGGGTLFLDLYTQTWQLHGAYDSTFAQGSLTVGSPELSATPLPAALPLFAGGLSVLGLLHFLRKRSHPPAVAAV